MIATMLYLAGLAGAVLVGIGLTVIAGRAACPCHCHDEPGAPTADEQQWTEVAGTLGFPTHDYHHSRKDR